MFTVKEVIDLDGGDNMAVDDDTGEVSRELFTSLSLECIAPNCSQIFINQSQLDDHMLHDHSIRAFRCLLKHCDRSFGSSHRLTKHLNKYHRDVSEWHCGQCSKYYDSYDRLTKHTIEKHHRGRFGCCVSGCEFIGRRRSKVKKHFKREHQIDDNDSVVLIDDDDKEDGGRCVSKPQQQQPNDETQPNSYITLSLECIAPNCTEMFVNQSQLDDHLLRVHSIRAFRCLVKDCVRSFSSSRRLSKHFDKAHSDVTEWHCNQCSNYYESYDRLTKHTVEKHHRGLFECLLDGCEFVARKKSKVKNHFFREHQQQAKFNIKEKAMHNGNLIVTNKESVDLCNKLTKPTKRQRTDTAQSTKSKGEIKEHQCIHNIIISLKCHQPNCPQMFTNKSLLLDHMWQVHSIQRNQCLVKNCNQSFSNRQTLGNHIKQTHLNATEWECGQCRGNYYKTYHLLSNHTIRYHHLGQFQCSIPGCSYPIQTQRVKVKKHYEQKHKPFFICSKPGCGYRTYTTANLKAHERAHLGIKPYRCKWPQCAFASTQSCATLLHIRNVHLNPKKTLYLDVKQHSDPKEYCEVVSELLL